MKFLFLLIWRMYNFQIVQSDQEDAVLYSLKSALLPETSLKNNRSNADVWRRIGLYLQSKELSHHVGGGALQYDALYAFDNAIRLNGDGSHDLSIQVYFLRGILLKTIGNGLVYM